MDSLLKNLMQKKTFYFKSKSFFSIIIIIIIIIITFIFFPPQNFLNERLAKTIYAYLSSHTQNCKKSVLKRRKIVKTPYERALSQRLPSGELHYHHRLEHLQHPGGRSSMDMPPSPSPSSRSLAPFSSASSSLSEGSNQPSIEDSASIVTGIIMKPSFFFIFFVLKFFLPRYTNTRFLDEKTRRKHSTTCIV